MKHDWIHQYYIETRWDCNPRERDEDHIRAIAAHMNRDGYDKAQPVVIFDITDRSKITNNLPYMAATGHHRIAASLLEDDEFPNLPLDKVYCEIRKGTYKECYQYMLIDNFLHTPEFNKSVGKMPTRKELWNMRSQLLLFPDIFAKGDRLLAKEWGCHRDTVSKLRDEVIEKIQVDEIRPPAQVFGSFDEMKKLKELIETNLYLGLDGKKYPRTKAQVIVPATDLPQKGKDATSAVERGQLSMQKKESSAPTNLDQWQDMVKAQIKTWKKKREGCGYASLSMFLHATLKYHSLPQTTEITEDIYDKLMHLLTTKRTGILEILVKRQLRGESLWEDESAPEQPSEESDCIIGFIQVNANLQNFVFTENSEDVEKHYDCYALSDLPPAIVDEISRVVKELEAERAKLLEKKKE